MALAIAYMLHEGLDLWDALAHAAARGRVLGSGSFPLQLLRLWKTVAVRRSRASYLWLTAERYALLTPAGGAREVGHAMTQPGFFQAELAEALTQDAEDGQARHRTREEGGQPPARGGCASRGASAGAKKMVTEVRLRPPMDLKNPLAYSADEVLP